MRFNEFIAESEGGIIRRGQEVAGGKTVTFANGDQKINLQGTLVVPEDELKFETAKELTDAVNATLRANGNPKVQWSNNPGAKGGAALITLWADENNQKIALLSMLMQRRKVTSLSLGPMQTLAGPQATSRLTVPLHSEHSST